MEKPKTLVAMSGGVDSSVAAALLLEQGHDIIGVTLKTFCYSEFPGGPKSCCGLEGVMDAKMVSNKLGIQHMVYDVTKTFEKEVIDDFIKEYSAGRTPNPCVRCNATVKIPDLLKRAKTLGCTFVATGHYARIKKLDENFLMYRGIDRDKDQSYFLWEIPKFVLPNLLFPLGNLTKSEVRAHARRFGLDNAEKPESQEVCFIPQKNYFDFLQTCLPKNHSGFSSGALLTVDRKVIGTHKGFLRYTVGQRKGLGGGHGKKLYVIKIEPLTREVTVGEEKDLYFNKIEVAQTNVLVPSFPFGEIIGVQIRHRFQPVLARLERCDLDRWLITFETPAKAATPGQSAAVFLENLLLGGGKIESAS
ncbi:tRNA 2-thiouridine(34) synthase MnmA [bacterium]|nr:tRNA 2-thiouridine(34) synthase MnmA [bacterium]